MLRGILGPWMDRLSPSSFHFLTGSTAIACESFLVTCTFIMLGGGGGGLDVDQ